VPESLPLKTIQAPAEKSGFDVLEIMTPFRTLDEKESFFLYVNVKDEPGNTPLHWAVEYSVMRPSNTEQPRHTCKCRVSTAS